MITQRIEIVNYYEKTNASNDAQEAEPMKETT